jgi:hypothetical protein
MRRHKLVESAERTTLFQDRSGRRSCRVQDKFDSLLASVSESLKAQDLWFRVHVLPAETGLEQNPISWRHMHGKLEVNFLLQQAGHEHTT